MIAQGCVGAEAERAWRRAPSLSLSMDATQLQRELRYSWAVGVEEGNR